MKYLYTAAFAALLAAWGCASTPNDVRQGMTYAREGVGHIERNLYAHDEGARVEEKALRGAWRDAQSAVRLEQLEQDAAVAGHGGYVPLPAYQAELKRVSALKQLEAKDIDARHDAAMQYLGESFLRLKSMLAALAAYENSDTILQEDLDALIDTGTEFVRFGLETRNKYEANKPASTPGAADIIKDKVEALLMQKAEELDFSALEAQAREAMTPEAIQAEIARLLELLRTREVSLPIRKGE